MKSLKSLQCIFLLFILCIVCLGCCAPQNRNDMTNTTSNPPVDQSEVIKTYSAAEMCSNYSQLIYKYENNSTLTYDEDTFKKVKDCYNNYPKVAPNCIKTSAAPREFPHMALLGVTNNEWLSCGSLISNRWILSTAHYETVKNNNFRWARLGDLNYLSETDDARPMDYQIDQRVVHPDYQLLSWYNSIVLHHLDQDVKFSAYVRPICLNADPNWQSSHSKNVIATGWGTDQKILRFSSDMLKASLDIISVDLCNINYNYTSLQLKNEIVEDSMMCAGVVDGKTIIYVGNIGGPLQIAHDNYTGMYTQVGIFITSGYGFVEPDAPYIYTRVSKFLPWIEKIVWPKSG